MLINKLLGTEELPVKAQRHMSSFLLFAMIISFLMSLSSTFYVLFTIDNIGFALAAVATSIMLFTQLIFDYPSGSLGDWIGQRWVLAIAFIFYSINFFLLTTAQTFTDFAIIAIINGFGNAQSSGAFETWVDNNYRKVAGESDPDRKIYGFSRSRVDSINNLSLAASFIVGGTMATMISRQFVFLLQFGITLIVIILILIFIKDIKTDDEEKSPTTTKSLGDYFKYLRGGISFLFSSKKSFFFLVGLSVYNVTWSVWGSLILFPIYFGYTGADVLASVLRTSLFLFGIPTGFYMANISKKISNEKLPHILFLITILFFPSFITLTYLVPPQNELNIIGIAFTFILLASLAGSVFSLSLTLSQRIMLDLVPSEFRNSVYSLMPTIFAIIGIPVLPIAGAAVESFGLPAGILIAGITCFMGFVFITLALRSKSVTILPTETKSTDGAVNLL
ncbi:MAG: MFS transporter [Candidatus Hodarchaeales archaeon]|jgi:MFS family permease